MGHQAKWEYFRAIYERYHKAGCRLKHVILNEFCLNTGYHRKYAIRRRSPGEAVPQSGTSAARAEP